MISFGSPAAILMPGPGLFVHDLNSVSQTKITIFSFTLKVT